jgi:hypothetical protein
MKILSLVLLVLLVSLAAIPAKADCPPWTTPQLTSNWTCGDLGQGWTCWQITVCINPDGSVSQPGDYYYGLAGAYDMLYGLYPDVGALIAYLMGMY